MQVTSLLDLAALIPLWEFGRGGEDIWEKNIFCHVYVVLILMFSSLLQQIFYATMNLFMPIKFIIAILWAHIPPPSGTIFIHNILLNYSNNPLPHFPFQSRFHSWGLNWIGKKGKDNEKKQKKQSASASISYMSSVEHTKSVLLLEMRTWTSVVCLILVIWNP